MTGDLNPYDQSYQLNDEPQYEGYAQAPETPVRMISPSPRGPRNQINMVDMASLGAHTARRGVTAAEVTGLLQDLQTTAIKAGVEMFPKIVDKMHRVHVARVGEIIEQVRQLNQVQMPVFATGLQGMLGRQTVQAPDAPVYVRLDQVLTILTAAQVDPGR